MKFGICNEIFQGWEIEAILRYAAQLGYHGVELAPFTLARTVHEISARQRSALRDSATAHGLEIIGLHWLLAQTTGLHLTHPEAAVRQRTSAYLRDLVDCCADLGGAVLVLGSPQQRQTLPGTSATEAWENGLATLKDAVKQAEDRSVTLCIEPLGPAETNFINTAAEAIRFAQSFASPQVKIILDVKAMSSEAKSISDVIHGSAPHFAHFHANDPNLGGPGFGPVDFHPIAAALNAVNYNQYVSVEVFRFEEGAEIIASQSLRYLQSCFSNRNGSK